MTLPTDRVEHLPPSPLFVTRDVREHWDDALTRMLAAAHERVCLGSVTPTFDVAAFRRELACYQFQVPHSVEDLLPWIISQLEHGVVHVTNSRYFGLFNPAPTTPAQWADRIAATFNPQLATWTTSPAAVEIENHVIRSVIRRSGLSSEASGHFTTGGAEANYTALICALVHTNPRFADEGARSFPGSPVFYISRDSHLAWIKIACQAGLGRSAVRLIDTDGSGQMDPSALARQLAADQQAGCVPVMIVATAGTTNAGMIDPLQACADLARAAGTWFHVDAAWGGGLIASESRHATLAGMEQANSITIDAHKWFATTMGCGMFLVRNRSVLATAFGVSTSYMPSNDRELDPYVTSLQWSRRFLGLRLFLSLALVGWAGYAAHVERAIVLAGKLKDQLARHGWKTVNASPLAVLCIVPPSGYPEVRPIVTKVLASGHAWISAARFEGRDVIRACITHGETTLEDIKTLVDSLLAARADTSPATESSID